MTTRLTKTPLDVAAMIEETEDGGSGALVVFVGTVRDRNAGRGVEAITYSAQEPLCERVLRDLEASILSRYSVRRCLIRHRVGRLEVGEASVAIVIRAAHREEAWEASRAAIDELKRSAPIWKQEHLAGGGDRRPAGVPLSGGADDGNRRVPRGTPSS